MKRQITITILLLSFNWGFSQELKEEHQEVVRTFIDCIKNDDVDNLKTMIAYPLKRKHPLMSINNEHEFQKRYHKIFDDSLRIIISSSDIENDWSAVGWRGIMFNNGELWLDYDGKLIALNYQSAFERKKIETLVNGSKELIHESIKEFEKPILIMGTKRFRVRIDQLSNGKYRYASWSIKSEMSEAPDLVLKNGTVIHEGSGGNHRYEFYNGIYTYVCSINNIGADDTPPGELIVYKNDKSILNESAHILRK